MVSLDFFIDI